jgi:hypothetical protein
MKEKGRNSERGQAMLIALIIGLGLILIMAGVVLIVRTQVSLGTTSTNNETSRDIAESGIDQYLWHLNQDSKFFTDSPNDPLNTAACIPVYKASSVILGYFVLDIVPPDEQFPYFAVQSTGWLASNNADPNNPAPPANSMNRTILVADLHEKEFTDYVDFCNISDVPVGYGYPTDPGGGDYKATGDVVQGPYKTNGNLRTWGTPTFESTVEFGNAETSSWIIDNGGGTYPWVNNAFSPSPWLGQPASNLPDFYLNTPNNIYPRLTSNLIMPSTNDLTQLDTWAHTDDQYYMTQNHVSYHTAEFPGRTCIYLHGSQFDEVYYDPSKNSYVSENNVPLPVNGVIYVEGTCAASVLDNSHKWDPNYGNVFVSGTLNGQLTIAAASDIYITAYNPTEPFSQSSTYYTGQTIDGIQLAGGVMFDQQLTGVQTTDSNNPDLLGLIANYNVRILANDWPDNNTSDLNANPQLDYQTTNTGTPGDDINPNTAYTLDSLNQKDNVTGPDITVQAAVMTVNGVFDAEGWNGGEYDAVADPNGAKYTGGTYNWLGGTGVKGHMDFTGSYAMVNDGYFAEYTYVQDHGYAENDIYDLRLAYETPPHFLQPKYSGWEVINWHSVPDVVALTPTTLPNAQAYSNYSQQITASGGTPTTTGVGTSGVGTPAYNFYIGGFLPPGLNLSNYTNSASCTLSGILTQAGTFHFAIIAADGNDYVGSQYYTMTVNPPAIIIAASPAIPSSVTAGSSGRYQLAASGGTSPYSYSISANPSWVSVTGNTLTIAPPSGTSGHYSFTVTATDADNFTGSQNYSLTVN